MNEGDVRRRRDAKLFNERLRLRGTLFNNLGVALFIALVVAPVANGRRLPISFIVVGLLLVVVLHLIARAVLRSWKSED